MLIRCEPEVSNPSYSTIYGGRCFPVIPVQAGTEQNQSGNTDIVSIYKVHVHVCPLTETGSLILGMSLHQCPM